MDYQMFIINSFIFESKEIINKKHHGEHYKKKQRH